jgi:hypothetical protein
MMDNLITSLYGVFTKSVVNGRIVWNIPCDPVTSPGEISWLPREEGEGFLCYMLRAFNAVFPAAVTLDGVQTLTNKTLIAPVLTLPTGIVASDIGAGAFGGSVTLAATQLTGIVPNANTTSTNLASPLSIVERDASGDFAAGTISADLIGDVTGTITGNVIGNVTGNVTGNLTGNASTTTLATRAAGLTEGTTGAIPYQSSVGNTTFLTAGTTGQILTQGAGVPAWSNSYKGTITNDSAPAGYVGEFVTSTLASGSAVTLTTATSANITSISLTAGDWDVFGSTAFILTAATSTFGNLGYIGGISTTSNTLGTQDTYFNYPVDLTTKTGSFNFSNPQVRISIASTTTVYLVGQATFSTGGTSVKAFGTISARRVR